MKVLVAAVSTPAHLEGGMERHLELLLRLLDGLGCETHLLTTSFPAGRRWTRGSVHAVDSPPAQGGSAWRRASREAFERLHRDGPFDRVLSEGTAAAALASLPGRPPLAAFLQGFEPEHLLNQWKEVRSPVDAASYAVAGAPRVLVQAWAERGFCRSVDRLWTAAGHIRDRMVRWYGVPPARVEVFPNWREPDAPASASERASRRASWDAADGETVFLFNAVLSRQKGASVALAAFDLHAARRPGTRLVVVGAGPELEDLKSRTLRLGRVSRVRFLGSRPNAEVPGLLAGADVFLAPTLRIEGMPYAVLEAAFAGLPVLATRLGGMADVLGEDAVYVRPGDAAGLAAAMDALSDSIERRRELGEAVRRRALELFGAERARAHLRAWLEVPS